MTVFAYFRTRRDVERFCHELISVPGVDHLQASPTMGAFKGGARLMVRFEFVYGGKKETLETVEALIREFTS